MLCLFLNFIVCENSMQKKSNLTKKKSINKVKLELDYLNKIVSDANQAYFNEDNPVISDFEYDSYRRKIFEIESWFPKIKNS